MQGTIVTTHEGYGFIRVEGIEQDIWFNAHELKADLRPGGHLVGQKVSFESWEHPRGLRARNIRPAA